MLKYYFLFVVFVLFISCSKIDNVVSQNQANRNQTLIINIGSEPYTLDPSFNVTADTLIYLTHIFEGLVNKDKYGKIIPAAAKSWNVSSDGLVYTFHLRDDAYWSDGNPVIAKDFVYSFRRLFDPQVKSKYAYQYSVIKNAKAINSGEIEIKYLGVEAIDDYTLEIILELPLTYFLEILSYPTFYPLREDIITLYGTNWTSSAQTLVGNGPFKVTERVLDKSIIMERNEFYWDKDNVYPSRLEFVLTNNNYYSMRSVMEEKIYFSRNFPREEIASLDKSGYIKNVPRVATYYYFINVTNEVLSDINIRKALSLAIDRNYIVENITKTGERPAGALVPYGVSGFFGDFRENGGDYIDLTKENYANNVKEAKRLMMLAGYMNGVGFPTLTFKTTHGVHKYIFDAIQKMWKEHLGINVVLEELEWADLVTQRFDKNIEIASGGWNGDFDDPINFLSIFLSYSANNNSVYSNNRYDDLIKSATLITDPSHRMLTMYKAEELLIRDMAIIPIYFYNEPLLVSPKLKGVQYDSMGKHSFSKAYLE